MYGTCRCIITEFLALYSRGTDVVVIGLLVQIKNWHSYIFLCVLLSALSNFNFWEAAISSCILMFKLNFMLDLISLKPFRCNIPLLTDCSDN